MCIYNAALKLKGGILQLNQSGSPSFSPSWFLGAIFKTLTLLVALAGLTAVSYAQIGGSNWTAQTPDFNVQSPYNLPVSDRYTDTDGVYHMWVFTTDEPFEEGNTTLPRTEQRFEPDYTSGDIQYQAMLMGDPSENSYSIFQIHTGDAQSDEYGSTTFMLFWFSSDGGSVHDYSGTELANNLGSNWFQLNVDHNLVTRTVTVWINNQEVWEQQDNGAGDFYMKDGVYEQDHDPTNEMDAWVKDIQFWTSPGTSGSPGFTLSSSVPSMTLQAGASAKTTISLTPSNGFNAPVTFACSGLPAGATCSFSPSTVTPTSGTATTTLTVTAASTTAKLRRGFGAEFPTAALAAVICFFGFRKRRRWLQLVVLAICLGGVGLLNGCSSGGSSGGSGSTGGSTSSTSTVTVTGTFGSATATANFSLTES